MKKNLRWYDKHKKLAGLLEQFKGLPERRKNKLVSGVMEIIKPMDPKLVEKHVLEFPLDMQRRRWYDADPYLWLLFNGLMYANAEILKKTTGYLEENRRDSKQ
ncbi:MAG: hypothetical protein WBM07_12475 [Chitinivibrionales bacterium]